MSFSSFAAIKVVLPIYLEEISMMQIFIRVLIAVLLKNMVIAQVLIGRMKFLALQVLRRIIT